MHTSPALNLAIHDVTLFLGLLCYTRQYEVLAWQPRVAFETGRGTAQQLTLIGGRSQATGDVI
jgi:hypothetical protein